MRGRGDLQETTRLIGEATSVSNMLQLSERKGKSQNGKCSKHVYTTGDYFRFAEHQGTRCISTPQCMRWLSKAGLPPSNKFPSTGFILFIRLIEETQ